MVTSLPLLTLWFGLALGPSADDLAVADVQVLRAAGVPITGQGLLEFFQKRTLTPDRIAFVRRQIDLLGSPEFKERDRATEALQPIAGPALGILKQTMSTTKDVEVRRRLERIVAQASSSASFELAQAAARQIAREKPPGTAKILFDYLPFLPDDSIRPAVQEALRAVAIVKGSADPEIVRALASEHAETRSAAALALTEAGGLRFRSEVQATLPKLEPKARLPILFALVERKDAGAVESLIRLWPDLSKEDGWQISDMLHQLADDKIPPPRLSPTPSMPNQQAAWLKWWAKHQDTIDLAAYVGKTRLKGFTIIGTYGAAQSKLYELDPSGKKTWEIAHPGPVSDLQLLGPRRFLVTSSLQGRVAELDSEGKVHFQKLVPTAISARRFPDGSLFVVCRTRFVMFDRAGVETLSIPITTLRGACRFPDGKIVAVTYQGVGQVYDAKGTLVRKFDVPRLAAAQAPLEPLPNGRFLISLLREHRVVEMDLEGTIHREFAVQSPQSVVALPNGNVLVTSQVHNRVVEFNSAGREVWSFQPEQRPMFARKR